MKSAPSGLAAGSVFEDRYELKELVGEGGFGCVYKAIQRTTGQTVALKLLHRQEPGNERRAETRVARFVLETRLCAQLQHPNIVQLIDAGQTDAGQFYTVMAFVPGETLADLLAREGALRLHETRHLMLQVLDALACAHAAGIVHRDLKPRNIMIVATGARRNAALLDFGIGAILAAGQGEASTRLTLTGDVLGTPGYAAPEQLRGFDAAPSADLFAWGLVFIECLTGKPVYAGQSAAEIIAAQLSADPISLPLDLDCSPLRELLFAATHKAPAQRSRSAAELLTALEACVPSLMATGLEAAARRTGPGHLPPPNVAPGAAWGGTERRQITFMCCALDTVNEGTAAPDLDERDARLRARLNQCVEIARRHHGYLAGAVGTEALFCFGYPRAEEDDARQAARAALAIQAALHPAAGRPGSAPVCEVAIRIGLHSGLVLVEPGIGPALGVTPWLAIRATAAAPLGTVVVTADTQRLLRSAFVLTVQGPREGTTAPTFLLHTEPVGDLRQLSSDARLTPLVGRDQELAMLLERWERASRGAGQCALITGEPGIGKSRLASELRERITGKARCLECRCAPDAQSNALYPIVEMLGRQLGGSELSDGPGRRAALASLITRYGLSLEEMMPLLGPLLSLPIDSQAPLLDISPQRQKELTLQTILSLLHAMSEERPIFLLVEDLHWADPTTIELLALLVHETPDAALCALFTARPSFSPQFPTSGMLQLHLNRLEPAQVEALVVEMLDGKELPATLAAQIAARTDGIPLFVEELTLMMLESGVLVLQDGRFTTTRSLTDVEVPATLRGLLAARMDRLGQAKATAQVAAAIGRDFDAELLCAVSPLAAAEVQEHINKLLAVGIIQKKRRSGATSYMFKHALIRDAAYESLPRTERRLLHGDIAKALEASPRRWASERPEMLAHHFMEAGLIDQAIPHWQAAGQRALRQSANQEAISHFERALDLLATLPDLPARAGQELGLQLALSVALSANQGYAAPAVGERYARAQQLCDQLGDSKQLFPVIWGLGAFHAVRGDLDASLALAERAQAIAESEDAPALLLAAHLVHGGTYLWRGELDHAREHFERGFSFYREDLHRDLATAYSYDPGTASLSYLALTLCIQGHVDDALRMASDATVRTRAMGHAHSYVHSLTRAVQVAVLRGEGSTMHDEIRTIIDMSTEKGFPLWRAAGVFLRGRSLCQAGQAEQALSDLQVGLQAIADTGTRMMYPEFLCGTAEAYLQLGKVEQAMATVDEALEWVAKMQARLYEPELLRIRGELLLAMVRSPADEDAAVKSLNDALASARRCCAGLWEQRAQLGMARLLQSRGRIPSPC